MEVATRAKARPLALLTVLRTPQIVARGVVAMPLTETTTVSATPNVRPSPIVAMTIRHCARPAAPNAAMEPATQVKAWLRVRQIVHRLGPPVVMVRATPRRALRHAQLIAKVVAVHSPVTTGKHAQSTLVIRRHRNACSHRQRTGQNVPMAADVSCPRPAARARAKPARWLLTAKSAQAEAPVRRAFAKGLQPCHPPKAT